MSKTCLVRFDNNRYSVSASAVGRPVDIHAYADRIVIRQDGRVVAEHPRAFGRGKIEYDPWHYVPVLARKPGALRNGAPFKDWVLPAALDRIRRKLAGSDDGDRQFVKILAAVLSDGLPAVEAACAQALAENVHSADVVLNILARRARSRTSAADPHPRRAQPAPRAGRRLRPLRQLEERLTMERTEVLDMMGELKLYGMKAAYDETLATALKRKHEPQRFVGDLLRAEISEKQARSIKYQLTIAKLPLAKDVDDFAFKDTPINEALVRDLAGGGFIAQQRNVVFVGGTGTGKTHSGDRHRAKLHPRRSARALLHHRRSRQPARGRGARRASGPHRRLSHPHGLRHPRRTRLPAVRPGRRPASLPPRQPALRAHLDPRHHQSRLRRMAERVRRSQDDHGAARSSHPSLRHRRDRQRELALQEPRLSVRLMTGIS